MLNSNTRVGVIVGSLRKAAYSRRVAHAFIDRAPDDWQRTIIEIADLPLYNQDLDNSPPSSWTHFRAEIASCDGLLFVTPEYNRSISGALKNATDISSRPEGENVFDALPAAIVRVTPYTGGGVAANHALRQSFVYINLTVMQQPEAYISEADKLVDEHGKVSGSKGDKLLRSFMAGFDAWVARVGSGKAKSFSKFKKTREAASNAYLEGDFKPLAEIVTAFDPASFFPPNGEHIVGAKLVPKAHRAGAKTFGSGGKGHFEVLASGSSSDIAWWTGIQHATVRLAGKAAPVAMKLGTTEVFKNEHVGWKLIHRHADVIND